MGLFRRTKKLAARVADTVWYGSTTRNAEKLRRSYRPNDIEAKAAIERAIGEVHIWAAKNADVCAQQPIRLYRRVNSSEGGRKISAKTKRYMRSGSGGEKAATFAEGGGDIEEVLDHPVLDLLRSPHPDFPGTQLAWMKFYMQEITGKAYQVVGYGDEGVPNVLLPLPTQYTELMYDEDSGQISGYQYARSETNVAVFEPDDVLYFRHRVSRFNPNDGEGPLSAVLPHADMLMKNLMHDIAMIDEGNRPDSLLSVNDPLATDKQVNALDKLINSKFGGFRNSNKTFVHKGDLSWTPMAWPAKELQSLEKLAVNQKTIRHAFGIPESMVDSNASTMASALVADNQYASMTIRPRLNMDAAHLNDYLLPKFGLDNTEYCLMYDDPVKDDVEALSARLNAKVAAGRMTINQSRIEEGEDPIDDPAADVLRVNGQSLERLDESGGGLGLFGGGFGGVPSGFGNEPGDEGDETEGAVEVTNQKVEETALNGAQIAQLTDLAAKVSLGELSREAARNIASAAFPGIPDEKIDGIFNELTQGGDPSVGESEAGDPAKSKKAASAFIFKGMIEHELPEWRMCDCAHTKDDDDIANEPMIERVFRDHLRGVERAFQDVVTDMQDEVIDAVRNGRPTDLDQHRDQAARVLREEMAPIIDDAVKFTLDAADQDVAGMFDVSQTSALEFWERHSIQVADDIASTTESMVRPAIQRGIEQGLSIDDIAGEMDGLPKWRAERIARTEVQNAAQGGRYETFKEIGVELVQWVTAPGASSAHQTIASRVYYEGGKPGVQKMGEPFVKAGETVGKEKYSRNVYAPPARPNCRCSIRAIFDTGDEG